MVEERKELPSNVIKEIANTFKQLQEALEPVRDRALDERAKATGFVESTQQFAIAGINALIRESEKRARMEGYAQCAEQFLSVIVTRMEDLFKQANEKEKEEMGQKFQDLREQLSNVEPNFDDEAEQAGEKEVIPINESSPA